MGSRIPSHQLSNGLYVLGRPEHHEERQPTIVSRAIPYTGSDVKKSGELGKMFDIPVSDHPVLKPHRPSSSSSGSFRTGSAPTSGSGPIFKRTSCSGPNSGLHPTGLLLTSSPLGSSVGRRSGQFGQSAQLEPPTLSSAKGKRVYGSAVTMLGHDDARLGFKKLFILVSVIGVLVVGIVVILWNCVCEGQFDKVTGVIYTINSTSKLSIRVRGCLTTSEWVSAEPVRS